MHAVRYAILLILTSLSLQSFAQSGVYIPPEGDIMIHRDTIAIFGDMHNAGRFGSMKGSFIYFYGERWRNEDNALLPDERYYYDTLRPDAGTFRFMGQSGRQWIYGGYNVATRTGANFPHLVLANTNGLMLEDLSDLKVRYSMHFEQGHLFLNGWNFVVGSRTPGLISGYTNRRFIVTGTKPGSGFLYREGLNASEGEVAFPIGTAPGSYSPLTIQSNEATRQDFRASVFDSVFTSAITGPAITENKVLKTWHVGGRGSKAVRLQHDLAAEDTYFSYNRDSSFISRYFDGFGWDTIPTTTVYNPGAITSGQSLLQSYIHERSFSDADDEVYLSKTALPKPAGNESSIDLTFYAYRKDMRMVQTNWHTRRERNILHFELQRRRETEDTFYTIRRLPPNTGGNSNIGQYYAHDDDNQYDNWTYYRVKTVARDGQIFYSGIKRVPWFFRIEIYPNPNYGIFRVSLYGIRETLRMEMYDMAGRKMATKMLTGASTLISWKIPSGKYILVFYDTEDHNRKIGTRQIIILR